MCEWFIHKLATNEILVVPVALREKLTVDFELLRAFTSHHYRIECFRVSYIDFDRTFPCFITGPRNFQRVFPGCDIRRHHFKQIELGSDLKKRPGIRYVYVQVLDIGNDFAYRDFSALRTTRMNPFS